MSVTCGMLKIHMLEHFVQDDTPRYLSENTFIFAVYLLSLASSNTSFEKTLNKLIKILNLKFFLVGVPYPKHTYMKSTIYESNFQIKLYQ